jgi:hypothetical protein
MRARLLFVALLLAFALSAPVLAVKALGQTPATPAAAPPPACTSPEHRQFDFWVGRWDVYPTGTDRLVAHSLIENLYGGCVIRENWMPLRAAGGGSLNSWIPAERRWRQVWADSSNEYKSFVGGMEGEAMVLTAPARAPDGRAALERMRFTREPGGAVRQLGTVSTDGGATWQPNYDFTYRPAR